MPCALHGILALRNQVVLAGMGQAAAFIHGRNSIVAFTDTRPETHLQKTLLGGATINAQVTHNLTILLPALLRIVHQAVRCLHIDVKDALFARLRRKLLAHGAHLGLAAVQSAFISLRHPGPFVLTLLTLQYALVIVRTPRRTKCALPVQVTGAVGIDRAVTSTVTT